MMSNDDKCSCNIECSCNDSCKSNGNSHLFPCPKIGEPVPNFEALTTQGKILFSDYNKDCWVVLFSHPADFTPVCTTEFLGFAEQQEEFDKRGVKLMGLSIDSLFSHIAWLRQIEKMFDVKIKFPVIADLSMKVAKAYGMIHPAISNVHAVRSVFIIDPEGNLQAMLTYPSSLGRNIDEVLRMIDSLQLTSKEHGIATQANWQAGDSVIIAPPTTMEEAEERLHQEHEECHDWFLCKTKK